MFSYEAGLFVALLLAGWSLVSLFTTINSRLNRNLRHIGQRISWATLSPAALDAKYLERGALWKFGKVLLFVCLSLASVLLSWLYVLYVVGVLIYRKSKDAGAPQAIREFRWKLRNLDMNQDQVIREVFKATEQPGLTFERLRYDTLQRSV